MVAADASAVAAPPFVAASERRMLCGDKLTFKRFLNVRQLFKEAGAVVFMGNTCEEVSCSRNKVGKETALLSQGSCQGRRKKQHQRVGASEWNQGLSGEWKRAEALLPHVGTNVKISRRRRASCSRVCGVGVCVCV